MRKQLVTTVEQCLNDDHRLVLLLGDIGVFGFNNAFKAFPERVYNIGILEQSTVGLAAGLAQTGFIPIVHTIAPFLIERSLEQLKDDFCYQGLGGNFVSVGGSYDYAAFGATHQCPADIGTLKNIPNMEIIVPGSPAEFDTLFKETYANGKPTYFRLSEKSNQIDQKVQFGKAVVIQEGKLATVIAVGSQLDLIISACKDMDVTILYYTTLAPFDTQTLRKYSHSNRILVVEPYYSGALVPEIVSAFFPKPMIIDSLGMPHKFLSHYGKTKDHDAVFGFTSESITNRLNSLIHE